MERQSRDLLRFPQINLFILKPLSIMSVESMSKKILGNEGAIKDLIKKMEKLGKKINLMDSEITHLKRENRDLRRRLSD